MIMRRRVAATLGVLALAAACGSANQGTPLDVDAGAGAGSGVGGAGSSGALMTGSTGSGDEFAACASEIVAGKPVPVTLTIMMDRSGSMLENQKWFNAQTALIAFFQDEKSAGLSVALRFFPSDKPAGGCNAQQCSAAACAQPLVDAAPLNIQPAYADAQEKALVAAVKAEFPEGQTPMFPALAGAESWAKQHAGPDHRTVVVLITDGEPDGCDQNIDHIAALAADAHGAGVLTFTIGMTGANQAQLDTIAKAGGSNAAFVIHNGTVTKDMAAALKKIKVSQIDCNLKLPVASDPSKPIDPALVNVTYGSAAGGNHVLSQVPGAAACSGQAWHYDDAAHPTQIILCPDACSAVQADPDAKVNVVLGCASKVL
jgi:hypothetical protein